MAKVWAQQPELSEYFGIGIPSRDFFFIKNEFNEYIAAVFDMKTDLHWYVSDKHRKQGHLTKALKESIIPYILTSDRNEQKITIEKGLGDENYKNSKKVAIALGFTPVNPEETKYILRQENFDWSHENFKEQNTIIASDRVTILKQRLLLSFKELYKISDELLMNYGEDENLNEIAKEISYFKAKIEDLEYDSLESN